MEGANINLDSSRDDPKWTLATFQRRRVTLLRILREWLWCGVLVWQHADDWRQRWRDRLHWEGSPHIQDSRASQERSQKKTHSSTLVEKVRNSALFYFCIVLGNLALFILFEVGLSGRSRRAPPTLTESILDPAWVAPCASLMPSIREVSQVHKSLTGNCHFRHGFRPQ